MRYRSNTYTIPRLPLIKSRPQTIIHMIVEQFESSAIFENIISEKNVRFYYSGERKVLDNTMLNYVILISLLINMIIILNFLFTFV